MASCCTQTLHAGTLQADVGWQNYLDFGRNMGAFKEGATNVEVVNDDGEVVSVIEVVPDLSAMRSEWGCSGALAGSQGTMVTAGHDYSVSSVNFSKKATTDSYYWETYTQIGSTSGSSFPWSDMRVSRLDKIVTDAYGWSMSTCTSVADFYATTVDGTEPTFIQVGTGTYYWGDLTAGETTYFAAAYTYLTAGTYDLTGVGSSSGQTLTNAYGESGTGTFYSFAWKYTETSDAFPMPKQATPGDSGSPSIYYNEIDKQWYYVGPVCSASTWACTTYMSYELYEWFVDGYTTYVDIANETTFLVSSDDEGIISLAGQDTGETITSQGLMDDYRGTTSTIGTVADSTTLMSTFDWKVSMDNLTFDFTDEVDTGAGIIYFMRDQDADGNDLEWTNYTLTSSNGEGIFNTAGYEVDEQVYVTTTLTGREGDEWRIVGEVADMRDGTYNMWGGIVEITGTGDNLADLNLGIGVTVYLNREDGYACNDVRINTKSTVILGGENQIGGTVSFGISGGTLNLNGYDFIATPDNFDSVDEDAIIANTGTGTTSTFYYTCSDAQIYQGSFADGLAMGIEDGGTLDIVFNGGDSGSWSLQGISSISGNLYVESGTVELSGFETPHAQGTVISMTTFTVEGDWTYGYFTSDAIIISDGANVDISQYVTVSADIEAGSDSSFSVGDGTTYSGTIISSGAVSFELGSTVNSEQITINTGGSLSLDKEYHLSAPVSISGALYMGDESIITGEINLLVGSSTSFGELVTLDGDVNVQSNLTMLDSTTVTGVLTLSNETTLTIYSDNFDDFLTMEWGGLSTETGTSVLFDLNLDSMLAEGQYTLITTTSDLDFAGSIDLTGMLTSTTVRQDFSLSMDSNNIYLNVVGYSLELTWSGADGATWSLSGGNWTSSDGDDVFLSLDTAIFSGEGGKTVSLSGALDPYQVIIDSTGTYTFTGSGELSSLTELIVKQGNLQLNNVNSHTGGTIVGGQGYEASLSTSTEGSLGTGVLTVAAMGTVTLNSAQNIAHTDVLAGGLLNIQNLTALRSGVLNNAGTVDFQVAGSLTQDVNNSGLIQFSSTGDFFYTTGDFKMLDGSSLSVSSGMGSVMFDSITVSGSQTWNVASGEYIRIGKANTYNQGELIVDGTTQISITGGGMVILDLTDIAAISADLSWTISEGSTLAGTNKGFGGLVTLDNGTLQLNYAAVGGGSASVGSWTMADSMDLVVESGGGTINFYLPSAATRTFGLAGALSGTGDLTIKTSGTTSGSTLTYTFSGDMSAYSGTITLDGSSTTSTLSLTSANLHTGDLVLNGSSSKVVFNSSSDQSLVGNISGSGSLQQSGSGTITLSGSNSYTGGTTLSAGTICTDNLNALGVSGALSMASGTTLELLSDLSIGRMSMAGGSFVLHIVGDDAATLSMEDFSYSASAALAISLDLSEFDGTLGDYVLIISDSGFGTMTLDNFDLSMFDYDETPVNFSFELLSNSLVLHVTSGTIWAGADPWTSDFGSVVEFTDATDGNVIMQGDIDSTDVLHSSGTHIFVASDDGTGALTGDSSLTMTGGSLTLTTANSFSGNLTITGGELLSDVDNSMGTGQLRVKDGGSIHLTTAQSFTSTQVDAGGELYLNVAGSLGSGAVNSEGSIIWEGSESATYTQNFSSSGLINITGTGDFIHSTGTLSMSDGASVNVAEGAGNFLIANLTLSGTQDWDIAEGEYLRVGTSGTNNNGVLTISSATTINLSGGGMAIFDLSDLTNLSSSLSWSVSGGSTIASTTAGFGGSVTLDNGTIQANYAAVGGGNSSVGNWVYGDDMDITILEGGGTINFYFPSATTAARTFTIASDISGTGDLTLSTSGTASSGGLTTTLSADLSGLSGDLILSADSTSTIRLYITTNNLHSGDLVIGSSSQTVYFNTSEDVSYAGDISGVGGIYKQGSTNLTLSGDNSAFSGTMTLALGWIYTESQNALGTGAINITGGGLSVQEELSTGAVSISAGSINLYEAMSADSLSVSGGTLRFFLDEDNMFSTLSLDSLSISSTMSLDLDMSSFDGEAGNYSLISLTSGWGNISLDDITYSITGYTDDSQIIRLMVIDDELVLNIDYASVWNSDEPWTTDYPTIMEFTDIWEGPVEISGSLTDKLINHTSGEHTFIAIDGGEGELTGTTIINVLGGSLTIASANSYSGTTTVGGNGEEAELYATAANALGVGALVVKDQGFVSLEADQGFSSVTVEAGGELSISSTGALGSGFLSNAGILNNDNTGDVTLTQSISNTGTLNFTGSGNFYHTTSTLALNDGTVINIAEGAGDVMIANLSVSGTQTWNIAEGEYLRMGTSGTNNKGVLSVSGATTINLTGGGMAIIDLELLTAISSDLDWNISGGSTLASTNHGFGGTITLDNGTLQANYAALGGGNASVGSWTYGSQMTLAIAEGGGNLQMYFTAVNTNRTLTVQGAISGTGDLLLQTLGYTSGSTCAFTISGDMSAYSGDITLSSTGSNGNSLTLSNANLHTGGLILADSLSTVNFNSSSNQNYVGAISGDGKVTKSGTGTLTLSGDSSYTGGTSITAGTVQTDSTTALGAGAVSLAGGSLSLLSDLTLSSMSITSGSLSFIVTGDESPTLSLTSLDISTLSSLSISLDLTNFTLLDSGSTTLIDVTDGWGNWDIDSFIVDITGYQDDANKLSLELQGNALVLIVTSNTIWDGTNPWTSEMSPIISFTDAAEGTVSIQGSLENNSITHVSGEHTFQNIDGGTGIITGSSSIAVTGGTLTISNSNDYTGDTTVGGSGVEATLIATGVDALGLGALIVKDMGYVSLQAAQSFSSASVQSGGTLSMDNAEALSFSQDFSIAGNLRYAGAGTWSHTGSLSMSDGASLSILEGAGVVSMQELSLSGSLTWDIAEGQELQLAGTISEATDTVLNLSGGGTISLAESMSLSSELNMAGDMGINFTLGDESTLSMSNTITGEGDLLVSASDSSMDFSLTGDVSAWTGTLILSGSASINLGTSSLPSGGLELRGSQAIVDGDSDASYATNISGTGSLSKSGAGTLTLSGDSRYTGSTTVTGGTVRTESATALGAGNNISISNASLVVGSNLSVNDIALSSGSIDLEADLTVSSVVVSGGELNFLLQSDVSTSILAESFALSGIDSVNINIDLSSFDGDISRHLLITSSDGWGDVDIDSFALTITGYDGDTSYLKLSLLDGGLYFVLAGETYWAGGSDDWSSSNWDDATGSLTTFTDGGNAYIGSSSDASGSSNTITLSEDISVAQLSFNGAGTWIIGEEGTDYSLSLTQAFTKSNAGTVRFESLVTTDSAITVSAGTAEFAGGVESTSSLTASGGSTTVAGESSFSSITQSSGAELILSGTITADTLRYSNGGLIIAEGANVTIDSGVTTTYWTASKLSLEIEENAVLSHNAFIQLAQADFELTGGGTYELSGIFLGFKNGSGSTVDILEGSTLHITGTDSATTLFANWVYENVVTVEGNLILDVMLGVNDGWTTINVNSYTNEDGELVGGTLQLSEGLAFSYRYASTGSTITINSGASLIVGTQSLEVSSSIEDSNSSSNSSMLTVTMMDGSTLAENGESSLTDVYKSITIDSGASVSFQIGSGNTMQLHEGLLGSMGEGRVIGGGTLIIAAASSSQNNSWYLTDGSTLDVSEVAADSISYALGTGTITLDDAHLTLMSGASLSNDIIILGDGNSISGDGTISLSGDFAFEYGVSLSFEDSTISILDGFSISLLDGISAGEVTLLSNAQGLTDAMLDNITVDDLGYYQVDFSINGDNLVANFYTLDTNIWQGGSGDWSDSNWGSQGFDSSFDTIIEANDANGMYITVDTSVDIGSLSVSGDNNVMLYASDEDMPFSVESLSKTGTGTLALIAASMTAGNISLEEGNLYMQGQFTLGSSDDSDLATNNHGLATSSLSLAAGSELLVYASSSITIDGGASSSTEGMRELVGQNYTITMGQDVLISANARLSMTGGTTNINSGTELSSAESNSVLEVTMLHLSDYSATDTVLNIGAGATVHVMGTEMGGSGSIGSFMISHWGGDNTLNLSGTLILDSGISNGDGSGVLNVLNGGVLQLNQGLMATSYRADTGKNHGGTMSINLESGSTLVLGNQVDLDIEGTTSLHRDADFDYSTAVTTIASETEHSILTVNMASGSTIAENGVDDVTTVYHTIVYAEGANIAFEAGDGKTLVMDKALSNINATVQGEGTVRFASGAALGSLNLDGTVTLAMDELISTTRVDSLSDSTHISISSNAELEVGTMSITAPTAAAITLAENGTITDGAISNLSATGASIATTSGLSLTGAVSLTDSAITGGKVQVNYGATLTSSNTSYDSGLELNGGALVLAESSLTDAISMTATSSISTVNADGLELNSSITYDSDWSTSKSLTLDLSGAGDISLGDDFSLNFSSDLVAGTYTIFTGVSNSGSLDVDWQNYSNLDSESYTQSWTWSNDNLNLTVTQRGDYVWDNDTSWEEADSTVTDFVEGSNLVIDNTSGESTTVSNDSELIAGNISISGTDDVVIEGGSISSDLSIIKTGENTVMLNTSMSAEDGIAIKEGSISIGDDGSINSEVSISQDASLVAGNITVIAKDSGDDLTHATLNGELESDTISQASISNAHITISKTETPMVAMLSGASVLPEYTADASIDNTNIDATEILLKEYVTLELNSVIIGDDSSFIGSEGSSLIADSVTLQASTSGNSLSIETNDDLMCLTIDSFGDIETTILNEISLQLMLTAEEISTLASFINTGNEICIRVSGIAAAEDDTEYNIAIMNIDDTDYEIPEIGFSNIEFVDGYLEISNTESIPEPSTATLSLIALAGLLARRRRKQA